MSADTYTPQAVALGYQAGASAPQILSQGRGALAQAIITRAQELGIPTKTDPSLVEFLMQLEVNAWVPPELFAAVAQVLAWAYEVDGKPLPFDREELARNAADQRTKPA
jgi:flagellar biosynthesis protein